MDWINTSVYTWSLQLRNLQLSLYLSGSELLKLHEWSQQAYKKVCTFTTLAVVSLHTIVSYRNMRQKDLYRCSIHCYLISVSWFLIHISKTSTIRALIQCQANQNEENLWFLRPVLVCTILPQRKSVWFFFLWVCFCSACVLSRTTQPDKRNRPHKACPPNLEFYLLWKSVTFLGIKKRANMLRFSRSL